MVMTLEVLVADAASKVDGSGRFTDQETLDFVQDLLESLVDLVRADGQGPES